MSLNIQTSTDFWGTFSNKRRYSQILTFNTLGCSPFSVSALPDRVLVWNWVPIYDSKDTANMKLPSQSACSWHLQGYSATANAAPADTDYLGCVQLAYLSGLDVWGAEFKVDVFGYSCVLGLHMSFRVIMSLSFPNRLAWRTNNKTLLF